MAASIERHRIARSGVDRAGPVMFTAIGLLLAALLGGLLATQYLHMPKAGLVVICIASCVALLVWANLPGSVEILPGGLRIDQGGSKRFVAFAEIESASPSGES